MPWNVENLTNRHIKCGDWVFLPKKIQRNIPDGCMPLEAWRQARDPDPTLRITDPDEGLLLVIPDMDPNGS